MRGLPPTDFNTVESSDAEACERADDGLVHVWAWRRDVDVLVAQLSTAIERREVRTKRKNGKPKGHAKGGERHPASAGRNVPGSAAGGAYASVWAGHDRRGRPPPRSALGKRWDRSRF